MAEIVPSGVTEIFSPIFTPPRVVAEAMGNTYPPAPPSPACPLEAFRRSRVAGISAAGFFSAYSRTTPSSVRADLQRPQSSAVSEYVSPTWTERMGTISSVTSSCTMSKYFPFGHSSAPVCHPVVGMITSLLTVAAAISRSTSSRDTIDSGSMVAITLSIASTAAIRSKVASLPTMELLGRIHSGSFSSTR